MTKEKENGKEVRRDLEAEKEVTTEEDPRVEEKKAERVEEKRVEEVTEKKVEEVAKKETEGTVERKEETTDEKVEEMKRNGTVEVAVERKGRKTKGKKQEVDETTKPQPSKLER